MVRLQRLRDVAKLENLSKAVRVIGAAAAGAGMAFAAWATCPHNYQDCGSCGGVTAKVGNCSAPAAPGCVNYGTEWACWQLSGMGRSTLCQDLSP